MENKVNFYENIDDDPNDFTNAQQFVEDSIDHIVADTITSEARYSGFVVSKSTSTQISVTPGRLYSGGKVYASQDTAIPKDFVTNLPVAGKAIVAIVTWGSEDDTDVQPRQFLINAETRQAQAESKAMTHARIANVDFVIGTAAPAPTAPVVGAGYTIIGYATISQTGVDSVSNNADAQAPVLSDVERRTESLEAFEARVDPEISTLTSALAALSNGLSGSSNTKSALTRAFLAIADLNAKVGIPSNAADASSDYLLDGTNSDLANALSDCKVMEGIRFPDDGVSTSVFNIFNPFDPNAALKSNGMLLPAYTRYLRSSTGPKTGTVLANSYAYNEVDYTPQTVTQKRISYGTSFDVCTNSDFWKSGSYNPITSIFTLPDGETYNVAYTGQSYYAGLTSHEMLRLTQFWTDSVSDTYWDAVVQTTQTIPGFHLFESFLNGQDQWIDAIGVPFGSLAASGDVTLIITEAQATAQPDTAKVLAVTTVTFANLVANAENVFALANPVLLQSGKRYSIGVITTQGHQVGTTDGANFPQGTFLQLSASGFAAGDLTKHLCLNFYGCKFKNSAVSIQLQNLQLAGGITSIQILAPTIVPDSTNLTYEIQLAGVWTPLNAQTVGQLNSGGSLPPNIPIRVTMTGTQDMMPAVDLSKSSCTVSRPGTSFTHIYPKDARTPPVSSSTVGVILRLESYDENYHSVGVKLLTGASLTTEVSPSTVSLDKVSDGVYIGTYIFNLGTPVSPTAPYKIKTTGTTSSALITFLGSRIQDYIV